MKENMQLVKLFEDLFDGDPWIDVNIMGTLSNLSPEKAAFKPSGEMNSIWEIVNHMVSWRENVLQRIQGKIVSTPNNNYFEPIKDTAQRSWEETLSKFRESQTKWLDLLDHMKAEDLSAVYAANNKTHYYHVHGIIQHDAYHLGQIVLLAKHFK